MTGMHSKKERLILFHVPKCGGVTVYRSLMRFFDHYVTSHDPQDESTASKRVPFIATHTTFTLFKYDPQSDWTATLLRTPQNRLRSQYRFWAGIKPSVLENAAMDSETRHVIKLAGELNFLEFLEVREGPLLVHLDNAMTRHFADFEYLEERVGEKHFNMACANLEKIDDIMLTETIEQDLSDLCDRLGRSSIYYMQRGNVTDDLYVHHSNEHSYVAAEIGYDRRYLDAVAPHVAYDTQLYTFAKELRERRVASRCRMHHFFLDIPGLSVFELTPNVAYVLADSPTSRPLLWGEWSSQDDTRAWTVGQSCRIRFKIRRSELARLESPTLSLKFEAFLPERRAMNRVDLEVVGSDVRHRILFLNAGRALDLQEFERDPPARTTVVAGDRAAINLPLTEGDALLEDDQAGTDVPDADAFVYFRIDLANLPNVPATLFGFGDDRNLGVALNEILLCD